MASNGQGTGEETGKTIGGADLEARRRALEAKLDTVGQQRSTAMQASDRAGSAPSGLAKLFRFSAEFVSGVLAGGLIGWALDHFAGTRPWGLIIFLPLGFATGVYNLVRSAQRGQRDGDDAGPKVS